MTKGKPVKPPKSGKPEAQEKKPVKPPKSSKPEAKERAAARREAFDYAVQILAVVLVIIFTVLGIWLIVVVRTPEAITGGCALLAAVIAAIVLLGGGWSGGA